MRYFVKTPWWLKKIYPKRTWSIGTREKIVYFTFDDGPHPVATPFVLDQLKEYNAKATFFCIGKNVAAHPGIYQRILNEGHQVGNHTQHHLNGWKTEDETYFNDVSAASAYISSRLFRPPYGRMKASQARLLKEYKVVMWDVLSADFDESIGPEQCLQNVIRNFSPGSIIIFHDSQKAFPRLEYALPQCLAFFAEKGYQFGLMEG